MKHSRTPRRLFVVLWMTMLLSLTGPAGAQAVLDPALAPTNGRYRSTIQAARDSVEALMARAQIPGLTAAVLVRGEIVWAEGFGWADVENRVPVWPHTKMRVGSVSKSLTSAALAVLVERGRLALDAPIQRYVPSFPQKRYPITTRQVAGHLAGIRHYREGEFLSKQHYETVEEGLTIFASDSLLFRPGTRYEYSSYGWNLVSAVVEGASGQNFLPFMRQNVFRPLHLDDTVADHVDSLIAHRTRFYSLQGDSLLVNAPYVDNSYKWAGGGFLSTAEDIARFGDAMVNSRYLRPDTRALLFTSLRTRDGEATGYGLGWFVGTDDEGRRTIGHSGGSVGGTTQLLIYPEQDVVVALIANLGGVDYQGLHRTLAEMFMPEPVEEEE